MHTIPCTLSTNRKQKELKMYNGYQYFNLYCKVICICDGEYPHLYNYFKVSSTRKQQKSEKYLLFLTMPVAITSIHIHSVYSVWGVCYFPFDLYFFHMSITLGLHKNHFSVRSNSTLHYEFKKFSSSACEGGEIHATRPQMDGLEFIFSSSFNLLSGRGVNEHWNDHMLGTARRNTKKEKEPI